MLEARALIEFTNTANVNAVHYKYYYRFFFYFFLPFGTHFLIKKNVIGRFYGSRLKKKTQHETHLGKRLYAAKGKKKIVDRRNFDVLLRAQYRCRDISTANLSINRCKTSDDIFVLKLKKKFSYRLARGL